MAVTADIMYSLSNIEKTENLIIQVSQLKLGRESGEVLRNGRITPLLKRLRSIREFLAALCTVDERTRDSIYKPHGNSSS